MGIKVDLSGLERLQRNLEKVDGTHEVTGRDLLTDDFIRANTNNFQTYDAFINASGIKSQDDIGTEAFDNFVAANTRFANWGEMFQAAGTEWMKRQLFS